MLSLTRPHAHSTLLSLISKSLDKILFCCWTLRLNLQLIIYNFGFVVPLALDFNSDYMKVRLRRAQCYEHEDRLEEALEGNILS